MCQHCIQNPRCIYIIHASRSFDPSLIIRLQVAYDASGSFHISLGRYISVHQNQVYVLVKADDGFGLANLTGASWVRHISGLRWGAVGLDLTVNWWRAMGGFKRNVSRCLFVTHFAHKNLPSGLSVFFIRKTRDYGLQLTYRVLHITLPFPFCKSYLFLPECDKVKTLPFGCSDQIMSYSIQSIVPPVSLELRGRMVVSKCELNMPIDTCRVSQWHA